MRRGFTLVELAVVCAIIAVLTAFLLPVLIGARKASQRASNVERMKQIGKAVLLYCGDYDDLVPPGLNDGQFAEESPDFNVPPNFSGVRPWTTFGDLIYPYIRNSDALRQVRPLPSHAKLGSAHHECDFLFDQWAGLRLLRYSSVAPSVTLLFPAPPKLDNGSVPLPCMSYDLGVHIVAAGTCEAETTWWHD